MAKTIGIDLGTTNSCVAVMEGSRVVVIPNDEGSFTTPSVVAQTASTERLVGSVARRQAVTNAENTVTCVKRFMGRRFDDPQAQEDMRRVFYQVVPSPRGDAWVQLRDTSHAPAEISSFILAKMKAIAEDYLSETVAHAVITVPAYFNDSQRQATRDAGRLAGLQVDRIINEPTAAALAFGVDKKGQSRVAVYDLGGGTFDISIVELSHDVFHVLSTHGDTHLGGEDFDNLIVERLVHVFAERTQIDLQPDKVAMQRVRDAACTAKHALSSALSYEVNLPFIAADARGPKHLCVTLTRKDLEKLALPLVQRTLIPCQEAMDDAGLKVTDIDDVLLVGGMTRMPLVQAAVANFFGRAPNRTVNPDEVVAVGAAVQGGVLRGDVKNVLLLDVTPLSLGVETAGGLFTALIPRNTTVPCQKSQVFSTAHDNQPHVSVHVLQGERPMAVDNQSLARFELMGIAPAPRGEPKIEVIFEIDANGMVHVTAKDLGTGLSHAVRVTTQSGLNEDEIAGLLRSASESEAEDAIKRQLAQLRNSAEGLIYSTERSLEEFASSLDSQAMADVTQRLTTLKKALHDDEETGTSTLDCAVLEGLYKALQSSAHRLAESIYTRV